MNNNYYSNLNHYLLTSTDKREINWFDLPSSLNVLVSDTNKLITIKKLINSYGKIKSLNNQIIAIKLSSRGNLLKLKFPIKLDNEAYFKLYALMISEGSIRTEFSLNVPEKDFHQIFEENIKKLISEDILIKKDFNNNSERSRAPAIIRHLIPLYNHLPIILFKNKEFAREYLKIVFEAEGCPIFNLKKHKKYIKLSRNSDVTMIFKKQINLPPEKRIFINKIKEKYPKEHNKIRKNPDSLILGEHLLLKYWFDIDSTLKLESIRLNSLGNRKGKISAKWVLYIYGGEDLAKFDREIGFISKTKVEKCSEMLKKIPSRKKQYFVLDIMKKIQKNNIFSVKDFNNEMKKLGYISPQKFIWDYRKNKKIIENIARGRYRLVI